MKYFFKFSADILPYITIFFTALYIIFFHSSRLIWVGSVVVAAWLIAFAMKAVFRKLRPHQRKTNALFGAESKFSFPSEHSAIFMALGVSVFLIDHRVGAVLIGVALLIGSSRAIIEVHFWRDIIVGWAVGIISVLLFL